MQIEMFIHYAYSGTSLKSPSLKAPPLLGSHNQQCFSVVIFDNG